ncbi:MAG: hypothetical protein MJK04_05255 [Psychrosphaera sp.]|nr:hypothetical protein [Psychrosphaera sp.]
MFVTFITFMVMLFWLYAAYLRKNDSIKLKQGAFALPGFFTFGVLILGALVSALMLLARLLSHIYMP